MAKKHFKPGLIPLVVTIPVLAVLVSLGAWQMSRSDEKQALISSYLAAPEMPAIGQDQLSSDWLQYRFRRIELSGRYDNTHQLLLENQIHDSQSGYIVLTPFELQDGGGYVLVNRGWIERTTDGFDPSSITITDGLRKISGLVNNPPQVGIKLGSLDDSMPGWPKAIPYVDNDWLALQIAADIKPWAVLLAEDEADGFIRQWQPSVRISPDKHMGYAIQWFSLAFALIFLFVIASLKPQVDASDRQDLEE